MKSTEFIKQLNETTAGATGSPSVAVSFSQEGNMPNEIIARQKTYTNQRTPGGVIKGVKAAKVK